MLLNALLKRSIIFNGNRVFSTRTNFTSSSSSSIVDEKVRIFNDLAATWWNPKGSMKHLHLIHPHHVDFMRRQLQLKDGGTKPETPPSAQPLAGYKIIDVGCGVGLMSEPLAFLGAQVTGIDPADKLIHEAKVHASSTPELKGKLKYIQTTAEEHRVSHGGQYDVVNLFLVIENLQNRQEFVDNCLALLKPNGSLFVGYCNRSILWSIYVLWLKYGSGLLNKAVPTPYNTHITHDELIAMVNKGHPCQLKGRQNVAWTLDGKSCRVIESNRFMSSSHFVRKDVKVVPF